MRLFNNKYVLEPDWNIAMKHLRYNKTDHGQRISFMFLLAVACFFAPQAVIAQDAGQAPSLNGVPGIAVAPKTSKPENKSHHGQGKRQKSEPGASGCRYNNKNDLQLLV